MKIVLSIKPEFANKIFEGTKKYEFRRSIFKNPDVKKVIVYASAPVQKIVGEFEIENVLNHDVDTLWNLTKELSGISSDYFYQYFGEKEKGFAIKIKNAKLYKTPKCLRKAFNLLPPQSFAYVK
jgi:predicted transcriptional regulator